MQELSRFRGMIKYTIDQNSPETDGDKTNDLRENLDIASAKLDSFKSQVMTLASSMINLLEDESHDSAVDNRDSNGFASVRPRQCRSIDTSGSQSHPTSTRQPSQGQPILLIVHATPRAEVTSPKPYSRALASAPPPQSIAVPQDTSYYYWDPSVPWCRRSTGTPGDRCRNIYIHRMRDPWHPKPN